MAIRIQLRRDTAANWVASNPVLRAGEFGVETDTLKIKVGDGTSTWNAITSYANVTPSQLSSGYVASSQIGSASGVAGLDSSSNLIVPGTSIIVEGATADSYETTITVTDPTEDRTITIPDATGTIALTSNIPSSTDALSEGATNKYFSDELAQDAVGNAVGNGLDYDDNTGAISVNPSEFALSAVGAPTGNVDLASYKITNLGNPTQSTDATNKAYVDAAVEGLLTKPAVDVATTSNITATYDNGTSGVGSTLTILASATLDIDGKTSWTQYDSVLVKDQTDPAENGRYVLTTVGDAETNWVFTRCGLCDEADEIPGAYIFVTDGTANGQTGWVLHVDDPATFIVGTDDIDVYQFSGAGTYTAGTGLTLTGTVFSINTGTTVDLSTSQTLTNKTIDAANNTLNGVINNTLTTTTGDVIYASAANTPARLAIGSEGELLTVVSGIPSWEPAPISLPDQSGNSGKYLTTDGTTASWGTLVVPITVGTATLTSNSSEAVDSFLAEPLATEYTLYLKQGSKLRSSRVIVLCDGNNIDLTEYAIMEMGGTMSGVVVTASTAASSASLNVVVTDAVTTNVEVKFSKVKL